MENPRSTRKSAIELAFEFQRLLDEGEVNNRAEIAARYGISRARVTQLLNLLRLPQSVLSLLLELGRKAGARFTERQLRPILRLPESAQIATLQQLQEHNREGWRLRTPILLSGVSYRTTHREQVRAADRDGGPVLRLGTQFDLQLHERFNILTGPHVASIYTMPQYAHAEPGGDEGAIGVTALEVVRQLVLTGAAYVAGDDDAP